MIPKCLMPGDGKFATEVVEAILDRLLARVRKHRKPWLIGLSGLQGSGKSTFAKQLIAAAKRRGIASITMSLDDFYLPHRERTQLARDMHPLFATRGVPGTHDISLLRTTLAALKTASVAAPAHLPRFDKGRDTRVPRSRWRRVTRPPQLVVLEGWCVGVSEQSIEELLRPLNPLERSEDRHRLWRSYANEKLATSYQAIWKRFAALIVLQAPSFAVVKRWRGEPEKKLRKRGAPEAMSPKELNRFLQHFERISRHALHDLPARADILVGLDPQHSVRLIRIPAR
ncbi:MAG: kinase [Dokdonella sp.]